MGSSSDWSTMSKAVEVLVSFGIAHEAKVVSAHRMPDEMFAYAEAGRPPWSACDHRWCWGSGRTSPGMLAAKTTVPVLGVPGRASRHLLRPGLAATRSSRCRPASRWRRFAIGEAGATQRRRSSRSVMLALDGPGAARRGSRPTERARRDAAASSELPDHDRSARSCPRRRSGILGGGQLGRYARAGGRVAWATARSSLDPDPDERQRACSPREHLVAAYDDPDALPRAVVSDCDVITTEFENAAGRTALRRAGAPRPVRPRHAPSAVRIAQDRVRREGDFSSRTDSPSVGTSVLGRATIRRSTAAAASRPDRDRQDRAPRLRRQGAAVGVRCGRVRSLRGPNSAASPASSSSAWPSRPS